MSEFATLSVKPDSLKANAATVMVRTMFTEPDDDYFDLGYDDDSALPTFNTAFSIAAASVLLFDRERADWILSVEVM